jgi:hypothetical protein
MAYFPLENMSDDELIRLAYLKEDKTDLELELATRLERLLEDLEDDLR